MWFYKAMFSERMEKDDSVVNIKELLRRSSLCEEVGEDGDDSFTKDALSALLPLTTEDVNALQQTEEEIKDEVTFAWHVSMNYLIQFIVGYSN